MARAQNLLELEALARVLKMLQTEFELASALGAATSAAQIKRALVR